MNAENTLLESFVTKPGLSGFIYTMIFFVFLFYPSFPTQVLDTPKSINQYVHEIWTTDNGFPQ